MRRLPAAWIATSLVVVIWLAASRPAAAQSWPMFQVDPSHTGHLPVSLQPGQFYVRWTRSLGTIPSATRPVNPVAAGDGRVYATVSFYADVPQLFALNTSDGSTLWTKSFGMVFSVNPPSYVSGRVYLQTCNHAGDTWLWAFDGFSGTKTFQAPHQAQWEEYYAPTVSNGRVYIDGGYYGGMYGFDGSNGNQFWFTDLPQYDRWTPAVDGTRAYAYVGSYAPGLYIKRLVDGTPWTPGFIPDPEFQWDGWSMNLAPVLGAYGEVLAIHDGRLISFNPSAGAIGWELKDRFTGQPSVGGGRIYAVNNGGLSVYDESSHTLLWSWTPPSGAITQPMIVTNTHVLASTKDTVYAIDMSTHASLWTFAAPYGQLAIADGTLFVAATDGTLTAISLTSNVVPTSISPTTGPSLGGTPVTISGSGFQPGASVTFGGIAAAVSSVTSTQILATTPPHAPGPVDVAVVNPDLAAGRLLGGFTYTCPGTAPTAAVSGTAVLCAGQSTNLSVSLTGTGPFSLVWSDGVTQSGIAGPTATRAVSPTTTTTYTILAVADSLCAGNGSGSAVVTVNTPSAAITAPSSICLGSANNASVPTAGSGATYAWTITNGTITSGAGTPAISFNASAPGPIALGVTVTYSGCSASSTANIAAYALPTATVTGSATICAGTTANLQAALTGTAPWRVHWSDGVIQVVSSSPAARGVSPAATTSFSVTSVSDGSTCTGSGSGSATITVIPSPSAAITGAANVCANSTGNGASVPNAGAGATYVWTIGNGTITAGTGTNAIVYTAGASGSVSLSVAVTAGGCTTNGSRSVTIGAPPTATVSGNATICAGASTPVQVVLTGAAPWHLTWSDGFSQTVAASPATRNVSPAGNTTYTITALTDASCAGTASGSAAITVLPAPSASVSGGATICPGDSVVLSASISGTPPITVQWSDGDTMSGLSPGTITKTVTPSVTTVYTIDTVTDATCSANGTGVAVVTVALDASAVAIVAPDGVCANATGLHASVPSAGSGATYAWSVTNGTITAGAGTNAITWSAGPTGPVALTLTIQIVSGCSISGGKTVVVTQPPVTPVITGPSGAQTAQAGLTASVASHTGNSYAWAIDNGTITAGNGTSRITFTAGYPGTTTLHVVETNPQGCISPEGVLAIPVGGLTLGRMVPIVLDLTGVGGARYTSELTLANPGPVPASVELTYTAAEFLGATGSRTVHQDLAAGQQLIVPDVLAYLSAKGLVIPQAPSSGEGGGTLRVAFHNVPVGSAAFAGARTTAPSGDGRAGLSYPGPRFDQTFTAPVNVFGLRQTPDDRTNLALENVGTGGPITLRVTLRSGLAGDARTSVLPDVTLGPGQWMQLNAVLLGPGYANAWARVERVDGTEPFLAYAVFNDTATNDGSYVPAIAAARPAGAQMLPVLVEAGTFTSELVLANPGARAADVTLSFVESLAHPAGLYTGSVRVTLQPGEQQIIPDAVAWLRGKGATIGARGTPYAGALSVQFSVAGVAAPGFAGARTAAPAPGAGKYGLFYPAVSAGEMASTDAWIFGLQQNDTNRSNLALVNGAGNQGPVTLKYELYDAAGVKAGESAPVTLGPGGWTQVNAVLSRYGLTSGYVHVTKLSGTPGFLAYGVLNDGATSTSGTDDGSYVSMTTVP